MPKKTPAGLPVTLLAVLFTTSAPSVLTGKLPPTLLPEFRIPIVPLLLLALEVCKFCGVGRLNAILFYDFVIVLVTPL